MSLLLLESFDLGDNDHRWTIGSAGQHVTNPVRTGTHSLQKSAGAVNTLAFDGTQEDDVMYCGFGFFNDGNGADITICTFQEDFGNINHLSLVRRGSIRGWELRRGTHPQWPAIGSAGTTLIAALPNVWFPNSWHYLELGVKIHGSAGWFELRQDGITRLRFDGDTDNAGADLLVDQIAFGQVTNGGTYWIDDCYMLNEQGSIPELTTWLGDTRCFTLLPEDNGNYSELVGSDGNSVDNYLLVDEGGAPVLTDYVASATDGDQDSYIFQDLPVTVGTIRGVEVRAHASKDDTGTKQIRMNTRRSGSDSYGPDHPLAAIPLYQTHHDILEQDPHAGPGDWTIPNVNDTEWGVQVRP